MTTSLKIVMSVVLCSATALGQERAAASVPFAFAGRPTSCEQNRFKFESYVTLFRSLKQNGDRGVLIAIARLGDGERTTELNRTRLYVVRATLIEDLGLREDEVVTAEAGRVRGYGGVDVYIGGKLVDTLLVNRGKGLCGDCCYPEGRKYSYPHHQPKHP